MTEPKNAPRCTDCADCCAGTQPQTCSAHAESCSCCGAAPQSAAGCCGFSGEQPGCCTSHR
jgi:hypothetical protein